MMLHTATSDFFSALNEAITTVVNTVSQVITSVQNSDDDTTVVIVVGDGNDVEVNVQ